MKKIIALVFGLYASMANATIILADYGDSTGIQTFNYTFTSAFDGVLTIGNSNQGDTGVDATLYLSNFNGVLLGTADSTLTDVGTDTSAYQNTMGEPGTTGGLFTANLAVQAGDSFSFDWDFVTTDYNPYNDFAFVDLTNGDYSVIAQIGGTVPVPAPAGMLIFGLGLVGLSFARKNKAA